jgi:hypothetical protein
MTVKILFDKAGAIAEKLVNKNGRATPSLRAGVHYNPWAEGQVDQVAQAIIRRQDQQLAEALASAIQGDLELSFQVRQWLQDGETPNPYLTPQLHDVIEYLTFNRPDTAKRLKAKALAANEEYFAAKILESKQRKIEAEEFRKKEKASRDPISGRYYRKQPDGTWMA